MTSFLLVFETFLSAFTILRMPINSSSGSLADNRSRHEKVMVTSAVGSRKSGTVLTELLHFVIRMMQYILFKVEFWDRSVKYIS